MIPSTSMAQLRGGGSCCCRWCISGGSLAAVVQMLLCFCAVQCETAKHGRRRTIVNLPLCTFWQSSVPMFDSMQMRIYRSGSVPCCSQCINNCQMLRLMFTTSMRVDRR